MMKKLFIAAIAICLFSCSSDDARIGNPFLPAIGFSASINTNLPQYSNLQFPGNAVYVNSVGVRGAFVVNTGSGILAWEASDPNHAPSNCSTMELNGIEVTCPCEDHTYNLYTGLVVEEDLQYPLLAYRTSVSGNIITISN